MNVPREAPVDRSVRGRHARPRRGAMAPPALFLVAALASTLAWAQVATPSASGAADPTRVEGDVQEGARDAVPAVASLGVQFGFPAYRTAAVSASLQARFAGFAVRVGGGPAAYDNPNAPGLLYFPFSTLPTADWTSGMRAFGANRSGGTRAHAGCDLYFPQGTWIHAVTDGRVVRGPDWFYAQTYAIEVDHGSVLVRYCEIQPDSPVRAGDTVQAGQRIARVGRLVGITVPSDMLHIEVYAKTATGPLTVRDPSQSALRDGTVPFSRRRDLMDPTPLLDDWATRLPA